MSKPDKSNPLLCIKRPWEENENLIWMGSTLKLIRNLDKFNFPGNLAVDKRQQVVSLIAKELLPNDQLQKPCLFKAEDLLTNEKEFLVEHFLSDQSFNQAGAGEAFVLDETGEFMAALNLKDHLVLECIDINEELEMGWNRLVGVEVALGKALNFGFSPKFGFLTSDPHQCGSGLVVTIFLHLPALVHTYQFDDIVMDIKEEGVDQTGLQGDPNELIGDIVAFRNRYTVGLTDESILSSLRTLAIKLVAEEKKIRRHLKGGGEQETAEVKNKISRAYAILLHSYQIEAVEALQALSLVKLGLDLGWVRGVPQSVINRMLFGCRRAHLLCHFGQKIQQEEMLHKRAEYIHKSLYGLELLI